MSALVEPHRVNAPEPATASVIDEVLLRRSFERLLLWFVVGLGLARLPLIWRLNVNWDEFNYLAHVHDSLRGGLRLALQTFHVHLFPWVVDAGANEIDQIIAARLAYFVLSLGSCAFLYRLARHYASRSASLFTVLCYLCYSNVLEHATSFRADGLVSFIALGAMAFIVARRPGYFGAAAIGGATALSLLISAKAIFVVPTIAILLVISTAEVGRRRAAGCLAVFAAACAVVFGLGLLVQALNARDGSVEHVTNFSRRAAGATLGSAGLLPGLPYVLTTFGQNGFVWIYIISGFALARSAWFRSRAGGGKLLGLYALALPLLSLLFYRNSYPYFFVLLVPPVLVLCALAFDAVLERAPRDAAYKRMALYMVAGVVWAFSLRFAMRWPDEVSHQRRVLTAVHEIFPQAVPYIDRSGFVSSFPKVGLFMSTWVMEAYHARGEPVYENLIKSRKPAFVVMNSPALALTQADSVYTGSGGYPLLPADLETLRDNFIHHWGPLYVAGRRIVVGDTGAAFSLLVPGAYTVESPAAVSIDGTRYAPGDVAVLGAGEHRVQANDGASEVVLRWGRRLPRPATAPPSRPIYVGF